MAQFIKFVLKTKVMKLKLSKKILNKFNKPDTFLVVSGWPLNKNRVYDGMAWYTKRTVEAVVKRKKHRFVVLVEKNSTLVPPSEEYIRTPRRSDFASYKPLENRVLVLPVFDKKNPSLFPVILTWLLRFNKIKKVFVHSEFHISGGIKNFVLLLPFLLLIKLTGRNLTFFAHNMIENFDNLCPHFNLKKGSLKLKLFNLGLKFYYQALGLIVDKIVVLDEAIEKRIKKYVNPKKVVLTPIWTENKLKIKSEKLKIRKKLGIKPQEKLILYFGFVTWYKGADWIINRIKNLQPRTKNIKLILAGGEAYSLKDKPYYQKYYQSLVKKTKNSKNITITGFVPEQDISLYFKAADLVVFPYRGLIGASGALTHALSFKKPFILSCKMKSIFENKDFQVCLKQAGLKPKDIIFSLKSKSFEKLLVKLENKKFLVKLKKLSRLLAQKRNLDNQFEGYYNSVYKSQDYQKQIRTVLNVRLQPVYQQRLS